MRHLQTLFLVSLLLGCSPFPYKAKLEPVLTNSTGLAGVTSIGQYIAATNKRPLVSNSDPWSLELSEINISPDDADDNDQIAVIFRVLRSATSSDIIKDEDGWILAIVDEARKLDPDRRVIWTGWGKENFTLQVRVVKLNKVKKEQISAWGSILAATAGVIPTYGTIASQLISAGKLIYLGSKSDYENIFEKDRQFHAGANSDFRFTPYVVISEDQWEKLGDTLWYDGKANKLFSGQVHKDVDSTWVSINVIKGSSDTFVYGTAKSIDEIKTIADDMVANTYVKPNYDGLEKNLGELKSSIISRRILADFEPNDLDSFAKVVEDTYKQKENLTSVDYDKITAILKSYMPVNESNNVQSKEDWLQFITLLKKNYNYSPDLERWAKKE